VTWADHEPDVAWSVRPTFSKPVIRGSLLLTGRSASAAGAEAGGGESGVVSGEGGGGGGGGGAGGGHIAVEAVSVALAERLPAASTASTASE
jgi:hypothetical protein